MSWAISGIRFRETEGSSCRLHHSTFHRRAGISGILGYLEWEHLSKQLDHTYSELYQTLDPEKAAALWSMFMTLNKVTAPALVAEIEAQGFRLVRRFETETDKTPPQTLRDVYQERALKTNQIVALFKKT